MLSRLWQLFVVFHRLGWTSFGGPTAHIGYFYAEFVTRRRWLDESTFAQDNALCQIMPGPASSQLGMLIGARQAGIWGSLVAWLAFTSPSALIMLATLWGSTWLAGAQGVVHGLLISAAVVVSHAVWGMAHTFCRDHVRTSIAFGSAVIVLLAPTAWVQLLVLGASLAVGAWYIRTDPEAPITVSPPIPVSRVTATVMVILFGLLLILSLLAAHPLALIYQTGALVFGGGHVVISMLQQRFVTSGLIANEVLLSGYATAQILPGPLFAFGLFVAGASTTGTLTLALLGLCAIFLPGWLLIIGIQPWWYTLQRHPFIANGLRGVQAAVVGLLAATLWDPIFSHAITSNRNMALWLVGLAGLFVLQWPAWRISLLFAAVGWALLGP
jgi:chromate transporter